MGVVYVAAYSFLPELFVVTRSQPAADRQPDCERRRRLIVGILRSEFSGHGHSEQLLLEIRQASQRGPYG
jgi:hypothetical protein